MGICLVDGCDSDAHHRFACPECTERMRRQLREIDTYSQIIAVSVQPGRGGRSERRPPGFGSRSPARDEVLVALDFRSRPNGDGTDDEDNATRSILGTLHGITSWIRHEQQTTEPSARTTLTITREILWLLPQIDWCATQRWVDDLASDLADLHGQCRRLAGDAPPSPVGRCLDTTCDGTVFPATVHDPTDPYRPKVQGGRCNTCHRPYDWLGLINIAVIENGGGGPWGTDT